MIREALAQAQRMGLARIDAQMLLLHALGRDLANSNSWPNWSQNSEFRATRDQTAGERGSAPAATPKPGERG